MPAALHEVLHVDVSWVFLGEVVLVMDARVWLRILNQSLIWLVETVYQHPSLQVILHYSIGCQL